MYNFDTIATSVTWQGVTEKGVVARTILRKLSFPNISQSDIANISDNNIGSLDSETRQPRPFERTCIIRLLECSFSGWGQFLQSF